MEGLEVTFVTFWKSYVIQFLAFPYFRQLIVRYYVNVRRDERNRANRSKRLTVGARILPIHHRGVRYRGGAFLARRHRVEKERLCGNMPASPTVAMC